MTERFTNRDLNYYKTSYEAALKRETTHREFTAFTRIIEFIDEIELLQSERQVWMDKADELQQRTIAQHQENERLQARLKELESFIEFSNDHNVIIVKKESVPEHLRHIFKDSNYKSQ